MPATAEQRALRQFAADFLVPKVLALEGPDDTSADFVDQVHDVLPEVTPHLVAALSESDDPEHRMLATGYLSLTVEAPPETVAAIARRLLDDPNPEAATYAAQEVEMLSEPEFSHPAVAAALRATLDDLRHEP